MKEYVAVYRDGITGYAGQLGSLFHGASSRADIERQTAELRRRLGERFSLLKANGLLESLTITERYDDLGILHLRGGDDAIAKLKRFIDGNCFGYVDEKRPPPPKPVVPSPSGPHSELPF